MTIATAAIAARTHGAGLEPAVDPGDPHRQGLRREPPAPLVGTAGRRGGRRRARGRRRVPGPSRTAALPQPPQPAAYDADQAELDALLDKISERGMDGLSGDEKRRLNELSKRMRNRK